jgi:hypothetical protein
MMSRQEDSHAISIKNGPVMEIDFERGPKVLNPEYGIPHLRPAS